MCSWYRARKLLLLAPLVAAVGCGTRVGNPDNSSSATTQAAPEVDFEVPTPAALALAGNPDDLLTGYVERINDDVAKLNADIAEMNKEYVFDKPTTITGKGPGGLDSGTFTQLTDGTYNFQVVVCRSGKVSKFIKWSSDGKHIASDRDLNQKPDTPENVHVRALYDEGTDKTLTLQFYGVPKGVPGGADGTMLASWDEAKQKADTNYTIRSVLDWFNAGETLGADEYLAGSLTPAGVGEFVGWAKRVTANCANIPTFSESAPTEQWCNSRKIGATAGYTPEEASTAWTERLHTIGVAPKANIGDFEIAGACP